MQNVAMIYEFLFLIKIEKEGVFCFAACSSSDVACVSRCVLLYMGQCLAVNAFWTDITKQSIISIAEGKIIITCAEERLSKGHFSGAQSWFCCTLALEIFVSCICYLVTSPLLANQYYLSVLATNAGVILLVATFRSQTHELVLNMD